MKNTLNKIARDTNIYLKKFINKQGNSRLIPAIKYGLFPGGKKIRSKILIDLGDIKGALKISTKIKIDRYQCDFYKKTSKVLLENGFLQYGMDFTTKIKNGRVTLVKLTAN